MPAVPSTRSKWYRDKVPEAAHLGAAERSELGTEVARRTIRHPGLWLIVLAEAVVGVAPILIYIRLGGDFWLERVPGTIAFVVASFWPLAVGTGFTIVMVRLRRRIVRRVLKERQIRPAVCLACGYDLRGSCGDVCPECGQVIEGRRPTSSSQT